MGINIIFKYIININLIVFVIILFIILYVFNKWKRRLYIYVVKIILFDCNLSCYFSCSFCFDCGVFYFGFCLGVFVCILWRGDLFYCYGKDVLVFWFWWDGIDILCVLFLWWWWWVSVFDLGYLSDLVYCFFLGVVCFCFGVLGLFFCWGVFD